MIGILNYGLGNINAFANIYRRLHLPFKIVSSSYDFLGVEKLILPGVGAFDHAMNKFNASGLREKSEILVFNHGVPVLGVCVGMQMLAESSDEGVCSGLGWIPGQVIKFDESRIPFKTQLPHMGWNDVEVDHSSPIFHSFPRAVKFYFLHSYYFNCVSSKNEIGWSDYGGRFSCAVYQNNIYGVQFHPEKSHLSGVQLLENFAKL